MFRVPLLVCHEVGSEPGPRTRELSHSHLVLKGERCHGSNNDLQGSDSRHCPRYHAKVQDQGSATPQPLPVQRHQEQGKGAAEKTMQVQQEHVEQAAGGWSWQPRQQREQQETVDLQVGREQSQRAQRHRLIVERTKKGIKDNGRQHGQSHGNGLCQGYSSYQ